jgi:hypothetical protein
LVIEEPHRHAQPKMADAYAHPEPQLLRLW